MDPFRLLSDQHRRILELSQALTGGGGDPSGTPSERRRLARQLVMEGSRHEAIEEQWFWPVVRDRLDGGRALALAGIQQETGGRSMLHELDRMKAGNVHFDTMVYSATSHLRSHLTYEESQVWPKLQLTLAARELEQMGDAMAASLPLAPTRPHPHVPPDAGVLRTLGPLTGVLDRTLDVALRRGR